MSTVYIYQLISIFYIIAHLKMAHNDSVFLFMRSFNVQISFGKGIYKHVWLQNTTDILTAQIIATCMSTKYWNSHWYWSL